MDYFLLHNNNIYESNLFHTKHKIKKNPTQNWNKSITKQTKFDTTNCKNNKSNKVQINEHNVFHMKQFNLKKTNDSTE